MNKREMDTLMKKVAEGDNDAFARLYGAAARGVLAFAYSYLRNYADAEDVTEEVFSPSRKKRISIGRAPTRGLGFFRLPKTCRWTNYGGENAARSRWTNLPKQRRPCPRNCLSST